MGPKNRKIAGQRWISLILISHYNLPLPSVKISSPPFFNSVEVKFKIHHLHHEKHPTKDRNFLSLFWITAQKVVVPCYPPSTSLLPVINNFNCLWEAICMGTTIILYSDSSPHSNKVLWHPSITPHKISSSHPLVGEFRFLSSLLFCEFSPLTTLSFLSILWTRHSLHLLKLFCLKRIPSICPSPGASVYYSKHAAAPPVNSLTNTPYTTRPFFVSFKRNSKKCTTIDDEIGCYFYVLMFMTVTDRSVQTTNHFPVLGLPTLHIRPYIHTWPH